MEKIRIDLPLVRFTRNLTQEQFASILNITQDKVSRMEQTGYVDLDTIIDIVNTFTSGTKKEFLEFIDNFNVNSENYIKFKHNVLLAYENPFHGLRYSKPKFLQKED